MDFLIAGRIKIQHSVLRKRQLHNLGWNEAHHDSKPHEESNTGENLQEFFTSKLNKLAMSFLCYLSIIVYPAQGKQCSKLSSILEY